LVSQSGGSRVAAEKDDEEVETHGIVGGSSLKMMGHGSFELSKTQLASAVGTEGQ
jgi:hypothetical protein